MSDHKDSNAASVRPYYQDDAVTIYHGDCREILPALKADLVLTDFPYGIGLEYGVYSDSPENLDRLVRDVLPLMHPVAPIVALTCGIGNWWRFPEPTWVLCWYQTNAMGSTGRWGFNVWQPVLVYGADPYLKRGLGRRPDLVATSAPGSGGRDQIETREAHPCPKPFESWVRILVRLSPTPGEVIVDPFMGVGATVAAAKYTGRRAIGIEIEERYCEVAATRCAQEVLALAV